MYFLSHNRFGYISNVSREKSCTGQGMLDKQQKMIPLLGGHLLRIFTTSKQELPVDAPTIGSTSFVNKACRVLSEHLSPLTSPFFFPSAILCHSLCLLHHSSVT
jgi:hypothetical protein